MGTSNEIQYQFTDLSGLKMVIKGFKSGNKAIINTIRAFQNETELDEKEIFATRFLERFQGQSVLEDGVIIQFATSAGLKVEKTDGQDSSTVLYDPNASSSISTP